MLNPAIAIVVLFHGVGHVLFLVPLLGIADWGQSTRSWLLTPISQGVVVGGGSLIWLAAAVGFCAAAIGLLTHTDWWRSLAVASAVISGLGIILFWGSPVSSSAVFAFAFDLVVFAALLVFRWNPS